VWRGKDTQDWSDLVVQPPPIYVQEKVHPKAIIADLQRQSATRRAATADTGPDLFADFNGLPDPEARLEFYQHDQHWSNRMILGDSLQVMASLAEREGLRGKVQCIYFDPPYGIKFNSNWQVSTQSRDVKDGKQTDISREPEQVKAFRDTWKDGIHSYLTYLRDRLTVARELLTESGSIFVQIGDENVHRIRALMDEVFGPENSLGVITIKKTGGQTSTYLAEVTDFLLWSAKDIRATKFRQPLRIMTAGAGDATGVRYDQALLPSGEIKNASDLGNTDQTPRFFQYVSTSSARPARDHEKTNIAFQGRNFLPPTGRTWTTTETGLQRAIMADRIYAGGRTLRFKRFMDDFAANLIGNLWTDVAGAADKIYVVQTSTAVIQRCILMASDPGDLVLDPTCGSGTAATVAEQWGRRWITIDTSRVALALARTRIMAAKYPYYLLADSNAGRAKEAALTGKQAPDSPTHHDLRQGFVNDRAPHVTLKSIANNAEIDVLWEQAQTTLESLRLALNDALGQDWQEWQIPREPGDPWPKTATEAWRKYRDSGTSDAARAACLHNINNALQRAYTEADLPDAPIDPWPAETTRMHAEWWQARIARQRAIDASIARKAEVEVLYDRPYEDNKRVRVAGPFTVESLSPHRVLPQDDMELIDELDAAVDARAHIGTRGAAPPTDFAAMVLDHLRTAGVHQHTKDARIAFDSLTPWPGTMIAAVGTYSEGETIRRAAILIGPEFGTLTRPDITRAAREASDARFDVLIACAFNYDAHAADLTRLGPLPILQARINPDLHMSDELKNTGKGNLFVVFGAPDIQLLDRGDGMIAVQVLGVDVFDPQTGDVRSGGTESIAAWFIDTMYNEESFFVRHAYFLGANDPYKSLKTALRAEIDEDAWASLYRDTSRPFPRPETGRIAVKVINHFGDEVMKVFGA
jgi:adenine-specific DNA-methyltransferase